MSLANERANWGVSLPRAFTREEKKLWTKEEKAMYKAFELHGKEQAGKLMRSYFARKRSEVADEEEAEEKGVSMTCSLLNLRKHAKDGDEAEPRPETTEGVFGDDEQEKFKEAVAHVAGIEDLEAITITKTTDFGNLKESKRLYVSFEICTATEGEASDKSSGEKLCAADIAAKLNEKDTLAAALAEKKFVGAETVHIAEVIGGARAAKKARKSIMDQMYGDSAGESKGRHGESDKHKGAD